MKRIALLIALCAPLAACTTAPVASVSQVAEKGETAYNDTYIAASKTGEALVKLGVLDKATYKALDQRAYDISVKVAAGQATLAQFTAAIAALSGGK